jgi:cytochrome P450
MYVSGRTHSVEDKAVDRNRKISPRSARFDRRKRQTGDICCRIGAAEEDGEKLTLTLVTTCILLLNAGHETAVHTANSHRQNPAGSRDIPHGRRADREEATGLTPLHMFDRCVIEDCRDFGRAFKRGDTVKCLLGT